MAMAVYLDGSRRNSSHQVSLSLESSAVLFILRYCNTSQFHVVLTNHKSGADDQCSIPACNISDLADLSEVESIQLPTEVMSCRLPVVVNKGDNLVRSGLCSTVRHIISHSHTAQPDDHLDDLLGFRGGTLKACSEISVWTKLCELELPQSLVDFQKLQRDVSDSRAAEVDVPSVPLELWRLEKHLTSPALHQNHRRKKQEVLAKLRAHWRELRDSVTIDTIKNEDPHLTLQKIPKTDDVNNEIMDVLQQQVVQPHCVVGYKILTEFHDSLCTAVERKKRKKKHGSNSRRERIAAAAAMKTKSDAGADSSPTGSLRISQNICPNCGRKWDQTGLLMCVCEQLKSNNNPSVCMSVQSNQHNQEDALLTQFAEITKTDKITKTDNNGTLCEPNLENSEQKITNGLDTLIIDHKEDVQQSSILSELKNVYTDKLQEAVAFVEKVLNFVNSLTCDDIDLDHRYAEGIYLTVADLLLFVFVYHFMKITKARGLLFTDSCPHLTQWFNHMTSLPRVCQTAEGCGFDLGFINHSPTTDDTLRQMKFPIPHRSTSGDIDGLPALNNYSKSRCRALKPDVADALKKVQVWNIIPDVGEHPCGGESVRLDWNSLPPEVHPLEGDLPEKRVRRKCEQIENLVTAVVKIARPGHVIVDFCCGGGHLGIVIAYMLPDCKVYLIENKEESLLRAKERVDKLGLTNVTLFQCNLEYFHGQFDLGTCLHGCGVATDMVLQQCLTKMAAFVVCPCCYGKVQNTHLITYPRSQTFRDAQLSSKDYITLGHAADQTEIGIELQHQGKYCSNLVDMDRGLLFKQHGYMITLCSLHPLTCTPKNNLLIGLPPQEKVVH